MTMPSSGTLNMGGTSSPVSVASELGLGLTSTISMNDSAVRNLAGAGGSGTSWSMNSLYGKSSGFSGAISTNQLNLNLRTWALANGWNGTLAATITVNSGVYIWSNANGTPAVTINGSWPGGITLVNNGYIMGQGGRGKCGAGSVDSSVGGPAVSLGVNTTIVNNGYIGGGGGGGGAGDFAGGGGGAGGGAGGCGSIGSGCGGAGGAIGASGGTKNNGLFTGGGGGRVFPGVGGPGGNNSVSPSFGCGQGGTGGGGGAAAAPSYGGGLGGAGGSAGNVGGAGQAAGGGYGAGGGGGWGASGGGGFLGAGQKAGGKAIALNGFTATRSGSGLTYGSVS